MAKITSFIMSEGVINAPDQNGNINQLLSRPLMVLRPQFIPSAFSFCFAVGVSGIDLSQNENKIRLSIVDPAGEEIFAFNDVEVPVDHTNTIIPLEHQGCLICIDVRNIKLTMEGAFELHVELNGEVVGICEIPVYRSTD